jgi:hypothetical protein
MKTLEQPQRQQRLHREAVGERVQAEHGRQRVDHAPGLTERKIRCVYVGLDRRRQSPVQEQTDQAQRAITHEHDLNRELQIEREPVLAEARQCRGLRAERPDQRAGQRIARE